MITLQNVKQRALDGNVYADTPSYYETRIRILKTDVLYETSYGVTVLIKAGFEWDEASVPWLFRFAFPKSGKYAFSALLHDALYYETKVTQKQADDEFYKWMKVTINPVQAWLRYKFVRWFGWTYWNKNVRDPSERCLKNRKKILSY